MYASVLTRGDIAHSVCMLSKYMHAPTERHMSQARRTLAWLACTPDYGPTYGKSSVLSGWCDADFCGDLDTRRSCSGRVFFLNGGPISWQSKMQSCTTDSSTEAEYVCLSKAGRLGQWLRQLVPDLGTPIVGPTQLHEDNAAAAKWAEGPCDFAKRRHIHRSYCTIGELVQGCEDGSGKTFEIWMVPTDLQRADLFTKSLGQEKHKIAAEMLFCSSD